jgi:glycosyltransferase involved in cell wall biosynthesis
MHADPSVQQPHPRRVVRRRVAWVTPDYPPDRGGVSDHSGAMVNALRAAGHEVWVCSRPHERGFDLLDSELAAYEPDLVVVAYVPLGYGPRTGGIAPAFTLWCVGLRKRLRCQAILLAHEVSVPPLYHWRKRELKLAALGSAQIAQFSILSACFDSVLFSNMITKRAWAKRMRMLATRFDTIRICSNIPYNSSPAPAAELRAAGYSVPTPTILFFGTGHQSVLFDYVEEAFLALLGVEPNAGLVVVGMSPQKLQQLRPSLAALGARVQALGYVPAEQVSLWLQVAQLVLAPLIEGVSARKGTVMAALQHGQAVVTTKGPSTCDDIAWNEICLLAPLDRKAFAARAVQTFHDPESRAKIGRTARGEYDVHASATVTASQILEHAEHAGRESATKTRSAKDE